MNMMTNYLAQVKELPNYYAKSQLLTAILSSQGKKSVLTAEDKNVIHKFVFDELDTFFVTIPTLNAYKDKKELFRYYDCIFGLIMLCHPSPSELSIEELQKIKNVQEIITKESFIEVTIDGIFEERKHDPENIKHLLGLLISIHDESQKGQLYSGLLHYRNNIRLLPKESRELLSDYICSEIERYLNTPLDEDCETNLEFACDVCKHFINDAIIKALYGALKLGKNNISYYAVDSLLSADQKIPSEIIVSLANDVEYASLTYSILKSHRLTSCFPAELANEEYLAKSDLSRWLLYPTELGKLPDKIEYLGKVKKKEVFHILRYTSDSENLEDALKGKWLIGWSSEDGGTFSNFDLYEIYEQKTVEKTLKFIKKKLL